VKLGMCRSTAPRSRQREQAQGDELQAHERDRGAPEQEIDGLLAAAEKMDAERMRSTARIGRATSLPEELSRRQSRLKKIGEAKAAMEQEAKEKVRAANAPETEQKLAEREEQERRTGKKKRGRKPEPPDDDKGRPDDTAQRNFTDPESRIMPDGANKGSFVQGYNAQIAVDSASQVIVAAEVTQRDERQKAVAPDDRADRGESGNRNRRRSAPTRATSARRM